MAYLKSEKDPAMNPPAPPNRRRTAVFAAIGLSLLGLAPTLLSGVGFAGESPYAPRKPFAAEPYVPPPPPESKVRLADNGDGTLTETGTGLMWTQKDCYADLGKCLNWRESREYVKSLRTGGHDDWRVPALKELYTIYDDTKENVMGWDRDKENPLHLDEKFADGAAYWYWAEDHENTQLHDCCALSFYFVQGFSNMRVFTMCAHGGVRAVRKAR